MRKRKPSHGRAYVDLVGYECQHPECDSGLNIECHHIIPIKQGGKDKYWNYIALCFKCHRYNSLHRNWEENITALFVWKSLHELDRFGFVLDENDPDYYDNLKSILRK